MKLTPWTPKKLSEHSHPCLIPAYGFHIVFFKEEEEGEVEEIHSCNGLATCSPAKPHTLKGGSVLIAFFLMRVCEVRGRDESTCTGHMAALIRQPGHEADNVSVSQSGWLCVCVCLPVQDCFPICFLCVCVCVRQGWQSTL